MSVILLWFSAFEAGVALGQSHDWGLVLLSISVALTLIAGSELRDRRRQR